MTTTQRAVRKQTASTYLQFIRATQHVAFHSGWTKTRTHTQIYLSSVLIYLCTNLIIEALDILYPHVWWWSCFVIFSTKVLFLKQVIKFQDIPPVLKIVGKVKEKRQKVRLLLTEREMQFWWKPFKGILISNDWILLPLFYFLMNWSLVPHDCSLILCIFLADVPDAD